MNIDEILMFSGERPDRVGHLEAEDYFGRTPVTEPSFDSEIPDLPQYVVVNKLLEEREAAYRRATTLNDDAAALVYNAVSRQLYEVDNNGYYPDMPRLVRYNGHWA